MQRTYRVECFENIIVGIKSNFEIAELIEYSFKKRTALDKLLDDLFWSKGERKENESFTNRVSLF